MATATTYLLDIERTLPASPDEVFRAFALKDELERWFCPEGMTVTAEKLELRVDGEIQLTMEGEGGRHTACGTFHEVIPGEKLVFTWQWQDGDEEMQKETCITIVFASAAGGTLVTFTHSGFLSEQSRDMHAKGWQSAFRKFDALFA